MPEQVEAHEESNINPLDRVEDVLTNNNWVYNRINKDELLLEVRGKSTSYRMFFMWHHTMSALQLYCQYDFDLTPDPHGHIANALTKMNQSLWMGHFELIEGSNTPCYRQTSLLRGSHKGQDHIEDLVDISLSLCEQYQPILSLLADDPCLNSETLTLAMMDTVGES